MFKPTKLDFYYLHMVALLVYSYTNIIRLTQQNNNTGQDGNQSSGAEPCRQDERFHVAGEDGLFAVTAAHTDYKSIGAAHRRDAVVIDFDGKVIHILGHSAEALPDHEDASGAICGRNIDGMFYFSRREGCRILAKQQQSCKCAEQNYRKVSCSLMFRCRENYPQPPVRVNEV